VNLLVTIAILSENVPQEHQLCMNVILISELCTHVESMMLVGRVVMKTRVEVEVVMGRCMVCLMAQRTIMSPLNICIEGKVAVSFLHQGKLNILLDTVQMGGEGPQLVRTMVPDDKSDPHKETSRGACGLPG
jgi:hypothetical protein